MECIGWSAKLKSNIKDMSLLLGYQWSSYISIEYDNKPSAGYYMQVQEIHEINDEISAWKKFREFISILNSIIRIETHLPSLTVELDSIHKLDLYGKRSPGNHVILPDNLLCRTSVDHVTLIVDDSDVKPIQLVPPMPPFPESSLMLAANYLEFKKALENYPNSVNQDKPFYALYKVYEIMRMQLIPIRGNLKSIEMDSLMIDMLMSDEQQRADFKTKLTNFNATCNFYRHDREKLVPLLTQEDCEVIIRELMQYWAELLYQQITEAQHTTEPLLKESFQTV
jgi:hypothetical protein